jgi:hypothetical protein
MLQMHAESPVGLHITLPSFLYDYSQCWSVYTSSCNCRVLNLINIFSKVPTLLPTDRYVEIKTSNSPKIRCECTKIYEVMTIYWLIELLREL